MTDHIAEAERHLEAAREANLNGLALVAAFEAQLALVEATIAAAEAVRK